MSKQEFKKVEGTYSVTTNQPSDTETNRAHLLALAEAYKGTPVGAKFAELLEDFDRCHYDDREPEEKTGE